MAGPGRCGLRTGVGARVGPPRLRQSPALGLKTSTNVAAASVIAQTGVLKRSRRSAGGARAQVSAALSARACSDVFSSARSGQRSGRPHPLHALALALALPDEVSTLIDQALQAFAGLKVLEPHAWCRKTWRQGLRTRRHGSLRDAQCCPRLRVGAMRRNPRPAAASRIHIRALLRSRLR